MKTMNLEQLENGVVVLTFDRHESSTNLIDALFTEDLAEAVTVIKNMDDTRGVILESTKSTFVAGGDLKMLSNVTEDNAQEAIDLLTSLKASFRELETLGKPVVACISGSALGGGLEVALACHHRIAVSDNAIKIGLPEVTLGLLPGAGGVSRVTRLLGLEQAIPFLTEGRAHSVYAGKKLGLIDEVVETDEQLREAALGWINANPEPVAPWDIKGFKLPGGAPNSPKIAQMLSIAPAMIKKKTQGCYPAANAILSTAVEGSMLSIEAAGRIETRYFMELAKGAVAKNIIGTMFFAKNQIDQQTKKSTATKFSEVGVLGAGMMGAGIAWACASKGLKVVLLDTELAKAEKGKAYSEALVKKGLDRGKFSEESGQALLNQILPTESYEDLKNCDLIIEAVFEDRALKADVYQQVQSVVSKETIIATNTSTLPISSLAESILIPDQFVGLHFFSPVDKMPLLEIIRGEQSSPETIERALAFAGQIGKTPIVVNDGRGFFTSRVFKMFTYEGMAMLAEGIPAAAIENAAWLAGYPVGPLAVSDEVTLTLMERIRTQTQKDLVAEGKEYIAHPGDEVIDRMLELNRVSKVSGAGFYEYPVSGKKHLWSGLKENFEKDTDFDVQELKERFLFVQAIETLRAKADGIVQHDSEANVGSILGFGYPAWTGGVLQFIEQTGHARFKQRAADFAEKYGERFEIDETFWSHNFESSE